MTGHEPVLVEETLDLLGGGAVGILLDATVGLGGHARAFLEKFAEARVIGLDRDAEILEQAKQALAPYSDRVRLVHAAFADLDQVLDEEGLSSVDSVLFDFGVSSPQLDSPERGFSFRSEGPLDMRMDRSTGKTAADLVNRLPEKDLGNLIFHLGGERSSRRVAAAIVAERRRAPIETTARLAAIVRRAVRGRGRIDAATRTFQALRIAVNAELEQIESGLAAAVRRLRPGGRLAAISFHSGEDRIVKHALRENPLVEVLTKKPIRPGESEARRNPRSRSARLRGAERRSQDA